MAVLLIAKVRSLNLRADCHRPEVCAMCMVRIRPQSGSWQSAVHWKVVCQGVIIVVAIRRIRAQELEIE
jgi:hypothetical protein